MKKLMLILFCFISSGLMADRFAFPVINEYELPFMGWRFPYFFKTSSAFLQKDDESNFYIIQLSGEIEEQKKIFTMAPFSNFNENNIVIRDMSQKTFSLFDVERRERKSINTYIYNSLSPAQYYQNGIFFGFKEGRDSFDYYPTITNIETGYADILPFYDKSKHGYVLIRDMSPDKMHLLWDSSETGLSLYDIQKQELSDSFSPNDLHGSVSTAIFLTNSLLYGPHDGKNKFLHDLFGNVFVIEKINDNSNESIIVISKDLTRCIISSFNKGSNVETYKLLDSTPLKDFLNKAGLLYKPTTATLNDDNVRIRENPNLEAKHMGFLKKGETISVLDRSGAKRTIDPWGEHYWYQIKRESDGLNGWTFGAFLDLKDEQGDIVINADEIKKRMAR